MTQIRASAGPTRAANLSHLSPPFCTMPASPKILTIVAAKEAIGRRLRLEGGSVLISWIYLVHRCSYVLARGE